MNAVRWMTLGALSTCLVAVYSASIAAPLTAPPALSASWSTGSPSMPWGIAVSKEGRVYVSKYQNGVVDVYDLDGSLIQVIGQPGGLEGEFSGPVGIAIGPDGLVYISDSENLRVEVFTPDGQYVREFTHPEKYAIRFKPWGIAVDAANNVYVSVLNNHTIYKFSEEGELLQSWGGFGSEGGKFVGPTGMAISPSGELYVVDSLASRIQVFTLSGQFLRTWGSLCDIYFHSGRGCVDPDGDGPLELGDGQYASPWGVALDSAGRVYVADSSNKRIVVTSSTGQFEIKWGALGGAPGQFDNPVGVALDQAGNVYVADLNNNRVQKFSFAESGEGGSRAETGSAPVVVSVDLPENLPADGSPQQATVTFSDQDGDVTEARFHVIDGKYDPFKLSVNQPAGSNEGSFPFTFTCDIPQELTLKLLLFDSKENVSAPEKVTLRCGSPLIGNYDAEQETARETTRTIPINMLILDDGVNTLTDKSTFANSSSALGIPSSEVSRAIERQIVPAVNGVWDQCGVAFRLANLAVIKPDKISVPGGNFDQLLFVRGPGLPEIAIDDASRRFPITLMEQALQPITQAALDQGISFDPNALTVFVSGARIVMHPGDRQHYGGVTTLNGTVSLIRWDSIFVVNQETGEILPPKRPITAIAHEFGHDFGLPHSNTEENPEIANDPLNLMLSVPTKPTAVPPQPTVNLVPEQCKKAEPILAERSNQ